MYPVADCPFEEYEQKIREKLGFDVIGHKLEIFGYCRDCRLAKNKKQPL
jgi:Fur family ferric uptake transcriptional regulator